MESTSFKNRQHKLLENAGPSVAIISAASHVTRSHDTEFPFRQDSNFKYLVGFNEPDCKLVIKKDEQGSISTTLFVHDKDEVLEMWMGTRLGVEKAGELLAIDQAYAIQDFETKLSDLMLGTECVYYDLTSQQLHQSVLKSSQRVWAQRKSRMKKPIRWEHIIPLVGRARLIKDQNEILAMKKACELTRRAHLGAMALANSNTSEKVVANFLEATFNADDGQGQAYDSIVAGGQNALILHYINNDKNLNDGELLLIDAGAQVNTYASDVTRTFPVNGKYTQAQKTIYNLVLESQKNALSLAKNGNTLTQIHKEASRTLAAGLVELGILEGDPNELVGSDELRKYYPHGTGHWIGLDVHDNSPYLNEQLEDIQLEAGMCFTCEPGLYFKKNDSNVPTEYRGIGIRIEDDILMTSSGMENLTRAIPKEIKDIEAACAVDPSEFIREIFK